MTLLVCGAVLAFALYVCWQNTLASPASIHWNDWALSEWLINYQGGFVRRGLVGQVIHHLAGGGPAIGAVNGLVFGIFAALCAALLCLLVLARVGPLTALMLLLVPGGIFGMITGNEFYFRKEIVFHVYLAAIAILYLLLRRHPDRTGLRWLAGLVIAAGSLVLPLVHEGFLFLTAIPSAVLLYWLVAERQRSTALAAATMYLALAVLEFLVLASFRGTPGIADAIWASLDPADRALISPDGAIAGGIAAVGWNLKTGLALAVTVMTSGTAWYWAFMAAASAAYLAITALASTREPERRRSRVRWVLALYALCLIGALPLFLLGWDWGRWIAAVNLSVVILTCAGGFTAPLPLAQVERLRGRLSSGALVSAALIVALLFGVSFKLPECCIVGSGDPSYRLLQKLSGARPWAPPPPPRGFGPNQAPSPSP
jgi:hypothetical protein